MEKRLDISVVVPLYNEEESLPELTAWIDRVARENGLSYEIVFVDDGSTDGSWETLERLKEHYPALRAIGFARNYGKSAALYCGFAAAEGDVVFTMDADLQDSPDEIPDMRRMILEEGYDMVSGWKLKRHDPIGKRWPSKFFNWTARTVSGIKLHDFNCGLKAYRRKVVKSIEVYGEMHRYIPILAKEAGFRRIGEKVVCHRARKYGSSKFGMERMVKGYLDLITVSFLSHFGRSGWGRSCSCWAAARRSGSSPPSSTSRRTACRCGPSPSSRSSTFRCFWSSSACSFSWPVSWAS